MKKTNQGGVIRPEAWIAVSNNRQKVYDPHKLVYLDQNQEFQIELFNPDDISYLAKIGINGKSISQAGLVIKPGQRYFLDRFIDSNKKLLFSTYEVENNNPEVERAIENNGKISVRFYPETRWLDVGRYWYGSNTTTISPSKWNNTISTGNTNIFLCSGTSTHTLSGSITTSGIVNSYVSSLSASNFVNTSIAGSLSPNTKETGRIEEGSKSDQTFSDSDLKFSGSFTYSSNYQILPRCVKPVEISEIRLYCTECGSRVKKKTWKFCPSCGEKIQ